MSTDRTPQEALVARLLAAHEPASTATSAIHVDDEQLALFAEGNTPEAERRVLVDHLADCGLCREKLGLLMIAVEEPAATIIAVRPSVPLWSRRAVQTLALAAGLLICVGLFALSSGRRSQVAEQRAFDRAQALLVAAQFDDAQAELNRARQGGIASSRLDNLAAQVLRKIPSSIALSAGGKLTDLGVGIGGIIARSPPQLPAGDADRVQRLLNAAAAEDVDAALNRAHWLLANNEPQAALEQLHALVATNPRNPWVWLGLGNGHYLLNEYPSAVDAFKQCLKLDPDNLAARMNLAMTLEEQGELEPAASTWERLLTEHAAELSSDERQQIDAQIKALQKAAQ